MVKPVPVTAAALMVTGAPPVELRVTDCVAGVFTATLPKPMLVALMLSFGIAALNCSANLCEALPFVAVSTTDCAELTDETFAEKLALVELEGTVTDAGTDTAPLLLERLTLSPPLGAELLNVTVHASVPDPVIAALLQDSALSTDEVDDAPVPLSPICAVEPVEELLVIVS